jgi:hypothetical protein
VYTCGLITGFGTQPTGVLIFYPVAGTYGTNIETTLSASVNFTNGCFTNLTLTGGNYEVDYYNRILLNIFVPFGDTNNWQLTDLATNLTSYVTFGQLGVFSNNVYAAALAAGTAGAATFFNGGPSNYLWQVANTNYFVVSNAFNFAAATFYTNNTGRRALVGYTASLAVTGAGQTPSSTLYIGNVPTSWIFTNGVSVGSGAGDVVTSHGPNFGLVGPGQVFVITNLNNSGTAGIDAGTSYWIGF